MRGRHYEVGIDKLVLEGFAAEDGERIRGAVELELTRLLTDHGIAGTADRHDIAAIKGEEISMKPGVTTAAAGIQIARSIHGALKR